MDIEGAIDRRSRSSSQPSLPRPPPRPFRSASLPVLLTDGSRTRTASELSTPEDADWHKLQVAAIWLEKARKGVDHWIQDATPGHVSWYRTRQKFKPLHHAAKYAILLMAWFEQPTWCLGADCPTKFYAIPMRIANGLVVLSLLVVLLSAWLRRRMLGEVYEFTKWHWFGFAMGCVALADCAVSLCTDGPFKLARVCRPFIFLCFTKKLRRTAQHILASLPEVGSVLAALAISVFAFAWFAIVLFMDKGKGNFNSWESAISNMWILTTTANSPDVFLDVVIQNVVSFLFFCVYIMITLYLLQHVLLAVVYNAYKERLSWSLRETSLSRQKAVRGAFHTLVGVEGGTMPREVWCRLFAVFATQGGMSKERLDHQGDEEDKKCKDLRRGAECVLDVLDVQEDRIDYEAFERMVNALFARTVFLSKDQGRRMSVLSMTADLSDFWQGLTRSYWNRIVDVFIVSELVVLFVQTSATMGDVDEFLDTSHPFSIVGSAYSALYTCEVCFEIFVLRWYRSRFLNAFEHRCEIVVILVRIGLDLAVRVYVEEDDHRRGCVRMLMLLRLIRGVRLLRRVRPLHNLWTFMIRLAPTYMQLLSLLFVVFTLYATIGEEVFGGKILPSNPALAGSTFAANRYWVFTFNDFTSGMMTLFVLIVVNNWFIFAEANMLVTNRWACLYFVSFFVSVNLIVLNIVVALSIECLQALQNRDRTGVEPPPLVITLSGQISEVRQDATTTLMRVLLNGDIVDKLAMSRVTSEAELDSNEATESQSDLDATINASSDG